MALLDVIIKNMCVLEIESHIFVQKISKVQMLEA